MLCVSSIFAVSLHSVSACAIAGDPKPAGSTASAAIQQIGPPVQHFREFGRVIGSEVRVCCSDESINQSNSDAQVGHGRSSGPIKFKEPSEYLSQVFASDPRAVSNGKKLIKILTSKRRSRRHISSWIGKKAAFACADGPPELFVENSPEVTVRVTITGHSGSWPIVLQSYVIGKITRVDFRHKVIVMTVSPAGFIIIRTG